MVHFESGVLLASLLFLSWRGLGFPLLVRLGMVAFKLGTLVSVGPFSFVDRFLRFGIVFIFWALNLIGILELFDFLSSAFVHLIIDSFVQRSGFDKVIVIVHRRCR